MQAPQIEQDATTALLNKTKNVNVTFRYDTTTSSSLDKEWPLN